MEVYIEGDKKRVLGNHGLPEHPWCPPKEVKKIEVKPKQKYFWSKRSPEYLEKIAARPPINPRQQLHLAVKDAVIQDVFKSMGMIDDEYAKKSDNKWDDTAEIMMIMFGFLALVFIVTLFCVVVTEDISSPIFDCFFF